MKKNSILCLKSNALIGAEWFSVFKPCPKGAPRRTRRCLMSPPGLMSAQFSGFRGAGRLSYTVFFFFWSENTRLWLVSIFCLFEMSFSMKVIYIFIISAYAVAHGVSAFLRIVCWIGTALALRRASPRLDAPFCSACCDWCGPLSSKQGRLLALEDGKIYTQ